MTASLDDAAEHLRDFVDQLQPGETLDIVVDGRPVAQLRKVDQGSWPCKAGSYRKEQFWMAPDFDAPLEEEFKEYMQ